MILVVLALSMRRSRSPTTLVRELVCINHTNATPFFIRNQKVMALSRTLLLCALVLITLVAQIESKECHYFGDVIRLNCDKYCCGDKSLNQHCRDDCDGVWCDSDDDCGSGCCRGSECGDCPLSKTIIIVIAGSGVVFLIIVIAAAMCCCGCCCCQSQPGTVVVGRWGQLHNANNLPVANPAVNVVQTSSNVYMQH